MKNNSNRNIEDIIYQIITKIPKENNDLIKSLFNIIKSTVYIAPEIQNDQSLWIQLQYTLNKYIGYERPKEDGWMKEIVDIYVGDI